MNLADNTNEVHMDVGTDDENEITNLWLMFHVVHPLDLNMLRTPETSPIRMEDQEPHQMVCTSNNFYLIKTTLTDYHYVKTNILIYQKLM